MAVVYKAEAQGAAGFSRPVVIKRIRDRHARAARYEKMFVKEARTAATLDHPNIVRVYDLGQQQEDLFMVLEYVPGVTLSAMIRHHGRRGQTVLPSLTAFIAVDVCKALEAAHGRRDEQGLPSPVIHRDVSPRNVLLARDGTAKLGDFGLAMLPDATGSTTPGVIKGTATYMSPEQARGERDLDGRSDLFSLGLVLYESLCGRRALFGKTLEEVVTRARGGGVVPLTEVAPGLPEPLTDLVGRLLALHPDDRPESAQAVRKELSAFLRGFTPAVDPTSLARAVALVEEWKGRPGQAPIT